MRSFLVPLVPILLSSAACSSLEFDLARVPFPVSAQPPPAGAPVEPFELRDALVLWVHGLFGESQPDVEALLIAECRGCDAVYDFRAQASSSFHAWLATHLSLGLVRYKTVTITGKKLRSRR
jgi:hypothetical protein